MLIRQKTGWHLHHQAYLWPRRNRSTVPTQTPTRRSKVAEKKITKNKTSTLSQTTSRKNRKNNRQVTNVASPSWRFASPNRQTSEDSCGSSSCRSSASSLESLSWSRRLTCSTDLDFEEVESASASTRATRRNGCGSTPSAQSGSLFSQHKKRKAHGRLNVNTGHALRGQAAGGGDVFGTSESTSRFGDGATTDGRSRTTCCNRSHVHSTRTCRSIRSREPCRAQPVVQVCNLICNSIGQGSNKDNSTGCHSNKQNKGNIPLTSSANDSMQESHCGCISGGHSLGKDFSDNETKQNNDSCEITSTNKLVPSRFASSLNTNSSIAITTELGVSASTCNSHLTKSSFNQDCSESFNNPECSRSSYNIDDSHSIKPLKDGGDFNAVDRDQHSHISIPRSLRQRIELRKKMTLGNSVFIKKENFKRQYVRVTENPKLNSKRRRTEQLCSNKEVMTEQETCLPKENSAVTTSSPDCHNGNISINKSCTKFSSLQTEADCYDLDTESAASNNITTQLIVNIVNNAKICYNQSKLPLSISSSSSSCPSSSDQQLLQRLPQESGNVINAHNRNSVRETKHNQNPISPHSSALLISNFHCFNHHHKTSSGHSCEAINSPPASPSSVTDSNLSAKIPSTPSSYRTEPLLPPTPSSIATPPKEPPCTPTSAVACRWRGCSRQLDASDLLEHIRQHAEAQLDKKSYACFWFECKVYNKPSWSYSWLERHIVSHGGHRPFKCILDKCGQRFHSQAVLERHVNGHFSASNQMGAKSVRGRVDATSTRNKMRKRRLRCRFSQNVKMNDFFDEQTMIAVKQELQSLAGYSQPDSNGIAFDITFRGLVVGRRFPKFGPKQSLVEFIPDDVLENKWVMEENTDAVLKQTLPLSSLADDIAYRIHELSIPLPGLLNDNLHSRLYRRHRFRKHKRK